MKKFIFSIICTLFPMLSWAQEPYAVLSEDNTKLTFYYDDQKVVRNGMSVGPFVYDDEKGWYDANSTIETVVFDESFADCSSITSTAHWFERLNSLTTITGMTNLNTSNVTDMARMFRQCYNLTGLDLSSFETSQVTNMSSMFAGCNSLTSLDVSGFDTSNVTDMSDMFAELKGEQISLDLSGFNTSNVTTMKEMFVESSSLMSINLSNFDTSNVTSMEDMFAECQALISLDISSFNTSNVTNMKGLFRGNPALTAIYAGSEWNTASVTDGEDMFSKCTALVGGEGTTYDENHVDYTYAHIDGGSSNPGYFTASDGSSEASEETWAELRSTIEHGSEVLAQAKESSSIDPWLVEELENMTVKGSLMYEEHTAGEEEVRHMTEELNHIIWEVEEMMHHGGEAEPYAVLSENNTVLTFYYDNEKEARAGMDVGPFASAPSREWDKYETDIVSVVFDATFANCNSITSTRYWFAAFHNLASITGLDNLNTNNVTDMCQMFNGSYKLTNLDVSHFNTDNVIDMRQMFMDCRSLTNLDLSNFNTKNVEDMTGMFQDCTSLTSLDLSNFDTSSATRMQNMFENCSSLISLNVSSFNTSKVDYISYIFNGCTSLSNLDITNFNTSNATYMAGLFRDCSSLTSLDLSNFNTANVTNMEGMFRGCNNLKTIYVSDLWNVSNVTGSSYMFENCNSVVGSNGTTYDEAHIDVSYAHIDGGKSNPGYLTDINGGGEAYFYDYTAYVYGNATLDDAFAEVGRETAIQTIAAIVWEGNDALTADMLSGIDNPNLLVFVNEASKAPAGVQNVVVNGVAEEIILTDASGNNNFYCPQSFMARSISYSRDFSQTTEIEECRGWETISLPFTVQNITHETHGALVPFGGENDGYPFWLRQLSDNGLARATQIEANKPYLISMPNSIIYPAEYNQNGIVTFSSSNVTVPETSAQSDSYAGVTLTAAFQQVAQGNNIYALNVGEARGEYPEGSVFEQNYRDIRPFQAYTTHTAGARGFISLESLGGGNDDATGIKDLRIQNSELRDSDGFWYSLDGRRLNAKPTKKGVYVKDGRKIVIK